MGRGNGEGEAENKKEMMSTNKIINGDSLAVLKTLDNESVDCIVTSPPYWGLRDYGVEGQMGNEKSLEHYLKNLLEITAQLKRVLRQTGTLFWNHGDSYAGNASGRSGVGTALNGGKKTQNEFAKSTRTNGRRGPGIPGKSLTMQAHRLALRMMDEQGWILRNNIIWHKPNVMPSSAKDRFTVDFEPVFFFTKSEKYHFQPQYEPLSQVSIDRVKYGWKSKKANASSKGITGIQVDEMGSRFANPRGRNKRTVWKIPTSGSKESHVAMFPAALIEPMILAGCPRGGVVFDPFMGSGTTAVVATKLGRNFLGIELNPDYILIAEKRLSQITPSILF